MFTLEVRQEGEGYFNNKNFSYFFVIEILSFIKRTEFFLMFALIVDLKYVTYQLNYRFLHRYATLTITMT